jgi:hypothetical protein
LKGLQCNDSSTVEQGSQDRPQNGIKFDIRVHIERFSIDRETPTEYRCICPLCEGNNLTIAKDSGAYNCWNGCDCADIRNAIAPLNPTKSTRPRNDRTWVYTDAEGKPLIRTRRIDDGAGNRKIWQEYLINERWQAKGSPATKTARDAAKRAVMPYNYAAAIEAIAQGEPMFWVEGEPAVDELKTVGLTAITIIGGSGGYKNYDNHAGLLDGAKIIICPDGDHSGLKHATAIAQDYPEAQWLYAFPDSPTWNNPDQGAGLDVADWVRSLRADGLAAEQIRDRILGAVEEWRDRPRTETNHQPSGKPRLDLRAGQIVEAANTVLNHLGSAPDPRDRIYAQGNSQGYTLARVLRTVTGIEGRYLHVSRDNDVLDPVTPESLQCEINKAFEIFRWGEKDGKPVERRSDCPAALSKQILAMGRWPQLPVLRGLSYTPLLTKTGEIIATPGYHEGTGYLLQFDPTDYNLKQDPTRDDAIAALLTLKDLLSEFCFKTEIDRSAALSLLLTAVSRKIYPLAPLHAVNAHQPGTGKGTLINLAYILATGNKEAGSAGFTENEEEMGKKIFATLLSGTPIVNIDNVDRRLGGGTLERVLTAEFYKDRILGVSKNAVCSTQVLWTANGNNLAFTTDMTRPTVLSELDAGMESPETRVFNRDIEAYALKHRGELVSAALTVLQTHLRAGSPVPTDADGNKINPPSLGSFGSWDAVVRRSLLWLGEPDPVQSQATIREGDDSRIALSVFLEAWHSQLDSASMQVRDLVQKAITTDGDFKHAVLEVCLDKQGQPSTKILGYFLRRNAGVVVNGYRLVRGQRMTAGFPWKVEIVQPPKKPNGLEVSTSSTSNNAEIIDGEGIQNDVDESSIYIDKKEPSEHIQRANVDAKSSTLHLHWPGILTEKEIQGNENVDNLGRYKMKTEVIVDADDL